MSAALDGEEFVAGFLAEAEELISSARSCLTAIDASSKTREDNPRAVRELFRSLHTLKGLSAMIGAEPVVEIAHELETLVRSADRAGGKLPPRALDQIQKGVHAIEERVAHLGRGEALPPAPKPLIEALAALQFEARPARPSGVLSLEPELLAKLSLAEQEQILLGLQKGSRAVRVDFISSQARAAEGMNITKVRAQVGALGDLVKVIPRSVAATEGATGSVAFVLLVVTTATDEALAQAALTSADQVLSLQVLPDAWSADEGLIEEDTLDLGDSQRRNVVRVDVSRLDAALEGLSALVVTHSRLQHAVADLQEGRIGARELSTILAESRPQLRDLRAAIMRARMVPVSELLDRVPLLVRGLSRSSNKLVRLEIDSGNSELDKAVADRLFPAVVHLIRNAVDHAIETPAERKQLGKPEEGQIRIECSARSTTQLRLVISDDGRGIDRDKVAKRAGCAVPGDDAELLGLITRSGLSTLDKATHTSGRGLGMDIVKRIVVDDLGGELRLRTEPGAGTQFTLVVPLSVTILDVFSFISGERTFVVPVSAVEEFAEVEPSAVTNAPNPKNPGGGSIQLLKHRGQTLPLYTLSSLLGFTSDASARPKAIIVRRDAEAFAFQVDKMLGQKEVVVRPLRDPLVNVPGVSGSTDLGDGKPTLVLDLLSLMQRAVTRAASARGDAVA